MKIYIEWTPNLAVHVPVIDEQHRELYRRMNELCNAIMEGQGRKEVQGFISYLTDYTTFHFRDEEALMREIGYPGYDAQRKAHTYFKDKVRAMADQVEAGAASSDLVIEVVEEMQNWFSNHIRTMDRQIGEFLHQQGMTTSTESGTR